jgi:hypothetical protein
MANDQFVNRTMGEINQAVRESCREIGQEMKADLVSNLSTQGSPTRRSPRGGYPYRQSGYLIRRIRVNVPSGIRGPDTATVELISGAKYSAKLQYDLDRPFMTLLLEEWGPKFPVRLGQKLTQKLKRRR